VGKRLRRWDQGPAYGLRFPRFLRTRCFGTWAPNWMVEPFCHADGHCLEILPQSRTEAEILEHYGHLNTRSELLPEYCHCRSSEGGPWDERFKKLEDTPVTANGRLAHSSISLRSVWPSCNRCYRPQCSIRLTFSLPTSTPPCCHALLSRPSANSRC
jgi:hypothetical protein